MVENFYSKAACSTTRRITNEKPSTFNGVFVCPENIIQGGLRTKGFYKKSENDEPLITIITVVYNGVEFLEDTIKSVINQSYNNVEYIVVDGGSTDGTLDIIQKYDDFIDYWISERDKGIYDAMNKGINLSCGDIVGIINADDYYSNSEVFKTVLSSFTDSTDIVCGEMKIISRESTDVLEYRGVNWKKLPFGMYINHPSTFVKKHVYAKNGLYDSNLRMAADYKFFLTCYVMKAMFAACHIELTVMRDGGESIRHIEVTKYEEKLVRELVLPRMFLFSVRIIKFIRRLIK